MSRQIVERIIAGILLLFLFVYVVYQAYRFFYSPVSTDTVFEYTVSRTLEATGIAVREEEPLARAATGNEFYPHDDASRVAMGETVVELHRDSAGDSRTKRAKELEEEIAQLQEAQNTAVDYAGTEVYNREIKAKLGEVSAMASTGRFEGLSEMRSSLTLGINKKLISNGKAEDFTQRIGELQRELRSIQSSVRSETGSEVTAPVAGYFSRAVDGYETIVTPAKIADISVDDCVKLISGEVLPSRTSGVGKMVYSEKWTFAVFVPSYQTEWINELVKAANDRMQKLNVQLLLDQANQTVSATVKGLIEEKGSENAILLLSCNTMNEDLINLRISDATIYFQQFTGIRIDASRLRFRANEEGVNERGVYVLSDHVVRFKLVDPIYEESGFVLSRTYYVDSPMEDNYVQLFDQVITKGTDLYDGKTIHDY